MLQGKTTLYDLYHMLLHWTDNAQLGKSTVSMFYMHPCFPEEEPYQCYLEDYIDQPEVYQALNNILWMLMWDL